MKHFLLYFFALLQINLFSQTTGGTTPAADDVIKLDPRSSQFDFVPGQILLKLKDDVSVSLAKVNGVTVMGVPSIDAVLQKYKMQKAEKLFPNEKRNFNKRMLKTSNGKEFEQPNLHNIYKIVGDSTLNVFEVINELKADPNVEYAEPNYILSIVDSKPVSPALTEGEMIEWLKEHPEINVANHPVLPMTNDILTNDQPDQLHKPNVVIPNDPLYPQQWGIPAIQVDAVWDSTTGDTTQLIAILDTGVDWLHPDLKNKIWTNPNEIPGNGIDDDHNGYVDDVRGWDWINNDNNPTDDNSHGTHVAGIAAAEANNGIGIAGVNWKAKIMPLKVFQSSGRGDAATIARSIIYATQKGATVINMSFGTYARSLSMEDALANAYATTLLVAAAGNDGIAIGPCSGCAPFFPAALSFVLGVQSPEASFSNYDQDGPTYSEYSDLLNYEMKAPGTNIISTIPNGNYRVYQGTSMAAPIVSGALSLYRKLIPYDTETNEFMWVKLIQATGQYLDINKALTINPKPEIWFLNKVMVDTIGIDDKDGRVDAGETIQMWFRARNTGGQVDSVYWEIRLAEFEDTTTCQIVKPTSYLGSISPYATRTSENDPMVFKISANVAHDRDITFDLLSWYKGAADTIIEKFVFTAENGEQLSGVLDTIKILYPNRLYLVNNSFKVGINGTLIIKPGTQILFYPGKTVPVSGRLIAEGKPDSMIVFSGYIPPTGGEVNNIFQFRNGGDKLSYCKFENINYALTGYSANLYNCYFNYVGCIGAVNTIENCNFIANSSYGAADFANNIYKSNFIGPSTTYSSNNLQTVLLHVNTSTIFSCVPLKYNNIFNYAMSADGEYENHNSTFQNTWISKNENIIKSQTFFNSSEDFQTLQYQYWGTNDSTKIERFIYDFMDNAVRPKAKFTPFLSTPPDSCHAIVWKVLVNGKDAQDEKVEPVGIGPQRFDVYFNRPMDKTFTPNVSFGVRYPFLSNSVNENGSWSDDGRIWTVYKTVKLYSGDGINRIRVTGAKDLEGWETPTEDMRFEFLISAAGSSSLDFAATAGLGKVNLEWSNPQDVPDLLGYNMYRLEHINDSTLTQPVMINTSLINDTLFTDYNVIPNKKYYYYYRVVRTDFSESDSSRVVSTTPYTAALGDGNGDLAVNVLDVLATVSYILGQNPQPFIFDAADVVRDSIINVLDVVGNVNIILKGTLLKNYLAKTSYGNAKVEFTGNKVYLTTDQPVAGIQLQFKGKGLKDAKFIYSGSAQFENMSSSIGDTLQIALMYSLSKNEFAPGKYLIGTIDGDAKGISLSDAVLSDNEGGKINLNLIDNGVSTIPDNYYLDQNYPNPFNLSTTIQYGIPAKTAGKIVIYNILGQQVRTFDLGEREAGRYKIMWDGKNNYGNVISTGVYIFRFESIKFTSAKKMILLK